MDNVITGKVMGKDEFLKLFTYQLRCQNPLKPMDSTEFTAQLAQFSSLEQLYNMNNTLQELLAYQTSLNNGMITNLIGMSVKLTDGVTGKVTGVSFNDGITYLVLDSGKKVSLNEVKEIFQNG